MITSEWRKSSRSNWSEEKWCASARLSDAGTVLMRNDKHPDGPVLEFTADEWRAFILGVQAGEFDLLSGQ